MIELLVQQPLLLLFIVLALGFALGRVSIRGVSVGVAAVLFVGLAVGALDPRLQCPEIVQRLGLVLFVYTVGLSTGPGFVSALRRGGLRDAVFALGVLVAGAGLALAARRLLHLSPALTAGLYAGSLTNTPALAAVLERVGTSGAAGPGGPAAAAVAAYAVSYPMGVLGTLLAIVLARRTLFRNAVTEPREPMVVMIARVTRADACLKPLGELARSSGWRTRFARLKRGSEVRVIEPREPLRLGDLVSLVGPASELPAVIAAVGEHSADRIDLDRRVLDYRRIFVSNPSVLERRIRDLKGLRRLGARITRLRRGDEDVMFTGGTVLQPGDRVRVLAPVGRMHEVARYFGDSYRELAEVDVLTFGLGAGLGLVLGMIPIPVPGGWTFQLGIAGGPLIAGLLLGWLGRSGPIVWVMPYGANLTLRQLGLVLFFAGVGTRSGWVFAESLAHSGGLPLFAAGAVITCGVAWISLWIGHAVLRIRPALLEGMVAGIHTQPAVLAFSKLGTEDEGPDVGCASVYPLATIAKIILAQMLLGIVVRAQ